MIVVMRVRLSIVVFLLLLAPFARAQIGSSLAGEGLSLTLQPSYPGPNETVKVLLDDYSSGLFGSEVYWYINDTLYEAGYNQRSITTVAGDVGSRTSLKAVLVSSNGTKQVATATLAPVYLDIIIEPQTHVPHFYKGRALPSVGSIVNATALVNDGARFLSNSDLVYTWRINNAVIEGGPLHSKNKVSFPTPQGRYSTLSLEVAYPNGTIVAKRALSIPSVNPEIIFYEVNALYGVESNALDRRYNLISPTGTLLAEPFYLDSQVFNNPDILEWSVNRSKNSGGGANPYEVTLEKTGFPGITNLGFHVRSTTQLLQGAKGAIDVNI
jgi:hypothetical protein